MKKSMKPTIVNTGRWNSNRYDYKPRRRSDKEPKDCPTEAKPHKRGSYIKEMSDRLGPLWRAIRSRIGDKWNDIFSDLCEHNDSRDIRGYHLRSHVSDLVQTYTFYEGTDICVPHTEMNTSGGDNRLVEYQPYNEVLYVSPEGILCLRRKTRNWKCKKEYLNRFIHKKRGCLAKGLDDIWYKVTYEAIEAPEKKYCNWQYFYDHIFQRKASYSELTQVYKKAQRCVSKKQLGKKDLRKYKLKNGSGS